MTDLNNAKVGDEVVTVRAGTGSGMPNARTFYKIVRVTDTQVVCAHDRRFRKSDGKPIGDDFSPRARLATQEDYNAENVRKRMIEARKFMEDFRVTQNNLGIVEHFIAMIKVNNME